MGGPPRPCAAATPSRRTPSQPLSLGTSSQHVPLPADPTPLSMPPSRGYPPAVDEVGGGVVWLSLQVRPVCIVTRSPQPLLGALSHKHPPLLRRAQQQHEVICRHMAQPLGAGLRRATPPRYKWAWSTKRGRGFPLSGSQTDCGPFFTLKGSGYFSSSYPKWVWYLLSPTSMNDPSHLLGACGRADPSPQPQPPPTHPGGHSLMRLVDLGATKKSGR